MNTESRPIDWKTSEGQEQLAWEIRHAGVPSEYADAVWERCRQAEALRAYTSTIGAYVARGNGLMMLGPPGTGKSCAAALVVREAIMAGLSARWVYVPELVDDIRDPHTRRERARAHHGPDLIVWDDFGVTQLSPWEVSLLDRLVEGRYNRNRAMIVTTNLTREQLRNAEAYARMIDRFRAMCKAVTMSGESMRVPWKE